MDRNEQFNEWRRWFSTKTDVCLLIELEMTDNWKSDHGQFSIHMIQLFDFIRKF